MRKLHYNNLATIESQLSHTVLRSFECAARHESFTMAAEELHLTQSAVSRHIKEFEQIVGTELFRRAGRRVLLTDVGKLLASELSVDLDNIHRTVMRAVSTGGSGVALHIATLPTFSNRWLIPRLPEFFARFPDIKINLSIYADPFDMDRQHLIWLFTLVLMIGLVGMRRFYVLKR